jgi:hypothetical protein
MLPFTNSAATGFFVEMVAVRQPLAQRKCLFCLPIGDTPVERERRACILKPTGNSLPCESHERSSLACARIAQQEEPTIDGLESFADILEQARNVPSRLDDERFSRM